MRSGAGIAGGVRHVLARARGPALAGRRQLGADAPYSPEGFALLIRRHATRRRWLAPQVLPWPLAAPLSETGTPIGDAPCRVARRSNGEDAATLEGGVCGGQSVDRSGSMRVAIRRCVSIAVRPLLPGDDPCMDLFGVGG
jgi:hypothetical protein